MANNALGAIPKGLITAVVTPLYKDSPEFGVQSAETEVQSPKYKLDVEGFKKLLMVVKKSPVLINGTDEGILLSKNIRKNAIESAMKVINGDTELIIGITGDSTEQTMESIMMVEDAVKELNYTGKIFLFDCPLWYHSNRGLPAYYEKLTEFAFFPIILSNNPGVISNLQKTLKRHNIRTNIFKKLSYNEKIAGLEHSGDLHRFLNYMRAARNRADFGFYDGNELNFLNNPSSSGVISIGANILYKDWVEVVNSSLMPDDSRKEDAGYCKLLWQKRETIKQFYFLYRINPVSLIKTALKHIGIINSDTAAGGLVEASSDEKSGIRNFLKETRD